MSVDVSIFREPAIVRLMVKSNTDGVVDITYSYVDTIWVQWTPLQGRLLERAKAFGPTVDTTLKTLWRPDVETIKSDTHVVYLPNRNITLTGVIPQNDNGLNETLTIYCSRVN